MRARLRFDPWLLPALAVAAGLRFTGLGWGSGHRPLGDEQSFVEAVAAMLANGDLDHRFYEYPGLFLYLLLPGQWLAGGEAGFASTWAGRITVAAFGVVAVGLVYALGRVLASTTVGRAAALLKAVSPLDVEQAHMIRTDVVLEVAFLLGLLALAVPLRRSRRASAAGAALGVASAIKFSGPLLAAPLALGLLLRRGPRPADFVRFGAVAALVFVACSPYTLLHLEEALSGAGTQVRYHYEGRTEAPGYLENLGAYVVRLGETLGAPWLLLAGAGAWAGRRRPRRFAPLVALPVVVLAVFATAEVRYDRFLVPLTGVLAVFAAIGIARIGARRAPAVAAATLIALAWPAGQSALDVRSYRQPSPRDQAKDALAAWSGGRALTTARELGTPPGVSLTRVRGFDPWTQRLAREHDVSVVIASQIGEPPRHLQEVRRLRPTRNTAGQGPELVLLVPSVPPALAYEWSDVLPGSAAAGGPRYSASGPAARAIDVRLPASDAVAAVEWEVAPGERPPRLRLLASHDGTRYAPVEIASERLAPSAPTAGALLRLLPLEPVTAVALRLETAERAPLAPPARLRTARPLAPPR